MCCYTPFVVWVWTDGMSNCHCLCSISLYLKNDNSILRDSSTHSAPAGKVSRSLMQICRDIKLMIVNIKCFFHIYYIHTYKSTYYIRFLRSFNSFIGTELLFPFRMLPSGTQVELPRHLWLYVTRGYSNMLWILTGDTTSKLTYVHLTIFIYSYNNWLWTGLCSLHKLYYYHSVYMQTYKCNGKTWIFTLHYNTTSL